MRIPLHESKRGLSVISETFSKVSKNYMIFINKLEHLLCPKFRTRDDSYIVQAFFQNKLHECVVRASQ
jgi:hypothetical protein